MKKYKVGIVVTTHYSKELRPQGATLIGNFVDSVKHVLQNSTSIFEYKIYIYDNSSTQSIGITSSDTCELYYVEDQTKRGLTGTWNDGAKRAIEDGCDVVLISNDDVQVNTTVDTFVNNILEHRDSRNSIYGPLSNGILSGVQRARKPTYGWYNLTGNVHNMVNGFFFGFTKEFYERFKDEDGNLFNEDYPWGGNEEVFQKRIWEQGGMSWVDGHCWIFHRKLRGWKQHH